MKLSILTPSIPSRLEKAVALSEEIQRQAAEIGTDEVEHLIFTDNRRRTIGAKRQALVDIARGEYVAFVDDDDRICSEYLANLLKGVRSGADVVTFEQDAWYNGQHSRVVFQLGQGDGLWEPNGVTGRDAWHVCAWRRSLVRHCQFEESNYGEDAVWCRQARQLARNSVHIDKVLHEYHHDAALTAAPE